VQGITQAGPTVSFSAMANGQNALARAILRDPDVVSLSSFIGVDGTNTTLNNGRFLINLKAKDDRGDSIGEIIDRLKKATSGVPAMSLYLQPVQDLTIDSTISRAQYQMVLGAARTADLN